MRSHPRALTRLAILVSIMAVLLGIAGIVTSVAHADDGACTLRVPADPLTATGLSTPYQLRGCDETNADEAAFVEAAVLDPATGAVSIYHPLVVNAGDAPAVAPVVPTLPAKAVVGIWFGSNANTLKLAGPGARHAVNGLGHSLFGQFAYIHAPAFFTAANAAIKAGQLVVPPLGTAKDGMACPTVRDFSVVDQDQSDNLATSYRVIDGKLAQNTAATAGQGTVLANGSDEGLLANLIDPALGCSPFLLPSLDDPGVMVPSLAANELSAAKTQAAPVARVPLSDPMTLRNGKASTAKTNLYRAGVDQRPVREDESPAAYCAHLAQVAPPRLAADATLETVPGPQGLTLTDFLAQRYQSSLQLLGCPKPHLRGDRG